LTVSEFGIDFGWIGATRARRRAAKFNSSLSVNVLP
jgi:hypothetical protein